MIIKSLFNYHLLIKAECNRYTFTQLDYRNILGINFFSSSSQSIKLIFKNRQQL